ncbi:hypothetical protein H4Q26_014839 [Puccinia striiformis f. sp. tritici PST-130]|nr:hypothetical protein H4Q26_014839 [Puccinia striiformis f. sp. tritici PST-130]
MDDRMATTARGKSSQMSFHAGQRVERQVHVGLEIWKSSKQSAWPCFAPRRLLLTENSYTHISSQRQPECLHLKYPDALAASTTCCLRLVCRKWADWLYEHHLYRGLTFSSASRSMEFAKHIWSRSELLPRAKCQHLVIDRIWAREPPPRNGQQDMIDWEVFAILIELFTDSVVTLELKFVDYPWLPIEDIHAIGQLEILRDLELGLSKTQSGDQYFPPTDLDFFNGLIVAAKGLKSLVLGTHLSMPYEPEPGLWGGEPYPAITHLDVHMALHPPTDILRLSTAFKPSLKVLSVRDNGPGFGVPEMGTIFIEAIMGQMGMEMPRLRRVYENLQETLEGLSISSSHVLKDSLDLRFPKLRVLAIDCWVNSITDFLSRDVFTQSSIEVMAIDAEAAFTTASLNSSVTLMATILDLPREIFELGGLAIRDSVVPDTVFQHKSRPTAFADDIRGRSELNPRAYCRYLEIDHFWPWDILVGAAHPDTITPVALEIMVELFSNTIVTLDIKFTDFFTLPSRTIECIGRMSNLRDLRLSDSRWQSALRQDEFPPFDPDGFTALMMAAPRLESLRLGLPVSLQLVPGLPAITYLNINVPRMSPDVILGLTIAFKHSLKVVSFEDDNAGFDAQTLLPAYENLRETLEGLSRSNPITNWLAQDMFLYAPIQVIGIGSASAKWSRAELPIDQFENLPKLKQLVFTAASSKFSAPPTYLDACKAHRVECVYVDYQDISMMMNL